MIEIGPATESEVVLAFLKAEIDYSAFSQQLLELLQRFGTKEELIDHADVGDEYGNDVRALLLDYYRGYLTRDRFFKGFPENVSWRRVDLQPADFQRLLYIANEQSWDSYSQMTRSPRVVADRIARGELPGLAQKVGAIQEKLKNNGTLPELVAVEGEGNSLILIEGAHRTTAYVGLKWNANVPAIIGSSPLVPHWYWYAARPNS